VLEIRKVDSSSNIDLLSEMFRVNQFNQLENATRVISEGNSDLWLADENGGAVGLLLGTTTVCDDGLLRGNVENCIVAKKSRLRLSGLGRQLIDIAEKYYRERGCVGMEWNTRKMWVANRELYQDGYRVIREYQEVSIDQNGTRHLGNPKVTWRKNF